MLLSLYASFRWAKWEHYIWKIAVFIILVSFCSATFGHRFAVVFLGPIPFLSFPFYAIHGEVTGPPLPPMGYGNWVPNYQIIFLTQKIYSIQPKTYEVHQVNFLNLNLGSISSGDLYSGPFSSDYITNPYLFIVPFLSFILINSVGALLGFLLSKTKTQKSKWSLVGFWGRIVLGFAIIAAGFWAASIGVVKTERNPPWGGEYVTWTFYPYREDAAVFVLFGIAWLAIMIIETLWRRNV